MREKRSNTSYSIRQTFDAELVKDLHSKIFPTDQWYEHIQSVYWIIWDKKRPVGFCMLAPLDKEIVFFSRAGLLPDVRGKGLHTRMIRVRERWARLYGFKKLITYTVTSNIKSSRNLQKSGYFLYMPEYAYAGKEEVLYWLKEIG